jgi:hypothetical protein
VLDMSNDKFASNILENVLKKGTIEEKVDWSINYLAD